jgi:hypothetical protein
MLLLEGYISNFTCAGYDFLYVEFSDFYVNQSLAEQTIPLYRDIKNYPGQRWSWIGKRPSQLISCDDFFGTNDCLPAPFL